MAQKTVSSLFNNFVSSLQKKPSATSTVSSSSSPTNYSSVGSMSSVKPTGPMSVKPTTVPSNTSATAIKPTTITPPQKTNSTLPPAGQQYVQSISQNNNGLSTIPGPYDAATGKLKDTGTNTPTFPNTPIQPPKPESPYLAYLKSMFDPEQLKTAQGNITSLNERTASELKRTREREDELRKNEIGQLERGQRYQLGEEERLSNRSLADLAIAKGANQDIYDSILGAGKSVYEAETADSEPVLVNGQLYQKQSDGTYKSVAGGGTSEGFTLGKDQVRYDAQGNIIAGNISTGTGDGTYVAGANPVVDAWVKGIQSGTYKASDVPDELRNQVAQAMSGTAKPQSEISKQVVTTIDDLLNSPSFDNIFGPIDRFIGGTIGPEAILAKNKYNQLKGLLSLDNIKYLKGTGAISDAEQKLLADAASAIGRNLYGEQARQELMKLKNGLTNLRNETTDTSSGGIDDSFFSPANFDN